MEKVDVTKHRKMKSRRFLVKYMLMSVVEHLRPDQNN